MKKLLFVLVALSQLGCSQTDIQGKWEVIGTSGDSLSLSGYGDLKFKSGYEVIFDKNTMNIVSKNDEIAESYHYKVRNGHLFIFYSDFGFPLNVEQVKEDEIFLYGGGWGNSIEEQSISYFLIALKKK